MLPEFFFRLFLTPSYLIPCAALLLEQINLILYESFGAFETAYFYNEVQNANKTRKRKKERSYSLVFSFLIVHSLPRLVLMSLASLNSLFKLKTIVLDQHHLRAEINRYSSLVSSPSHDSRLEESQTSFFLFFSLVFFCFEIVWFLLLSYGLCRIVKERKRHSQQVRDL